MTRVLILIKSLNFGGAERLLVNASRYLDRSRFEYEVAYLMPNTDALVTELEDAGLRVTCLGGSRGVGWIGKLKKLVSARRIDIVHVHSPYVAIGTRLAFRGTAPPLIVYTEHNTWPAYRRLTRWGNAATFGMNDYVFAVSEQVRASIKRASFPPAETLYHGIDPEQIQVTPDGVRSELGIPANAPVVGTVGNFRINKGHIYAVRAISRVREQLPNVRLVLVGMGPREAHLRREVARLGLKESVVFTGPRADAPRVASAFDLFVVPSYEEGLSIALVEAMTLGKASVVTRVGGLPEVVHDGSEGLIVPARDPDELARGILKLLIDDGLRERMGEAAKRRAAAFHIDKAVRRMEDVYEKLLAES